MKVYLITYYNTIIALTMRAKSSAWAESEARAVARGQGGVVALTEGTSKIMSLEMLLKRSQGNAIANFDRDFIPYRS